MKYLRARLRERSTWAALSLVFSTTAFAAAPEAYKDVMFLGTLLVGVGAALCPSLPPKDGSEA